jgi:signal transduction histidine kinase
MDAGYLRRITVTWGDDAHGRGPTGRCIRERKPVVAQNLLTEPDFEPWRAEARRRGYASSAALPLLADGHVLGALAIYAREPDAFDPLELRLLGELADDLAFGISTLRGRLERQALQAQLVVADRLSSMGALAAGVAHEINNPLAYVVSSLEVMEGALATARRTLRRAPAEAERAVDQALELVASAQEGAERVRTIVRDLKGFSRSDEESTGPTDVGRVVELAMSLASNETKHRARLVKKLGLLPPARCNEGRLGQVLLNLLVNAAHAIAPGHPEGNEIRVTGRKKGNRVLLEVRDTGSGIAPEHLGRIFDPFFTTKPLGQGTGLGLSICHTIVSSMGGEITVASKIGKGTVFTLAVPAGEAAPRPRAGDRAPRSARTR